ncbi:Nucleotidyltransferase-like [Alteribacillus persepolensis]|uniref:Nucleotidyltransferase-like n=1 Tax=Alteribacillus persepolensis TaxID=568899 RepID=A0A1G8CEJ2_9BACI|nr:nucleotidyltransferase-like protein [Alteribacillus persepolensis]SDH43867.1 Nucleotidyltransferase-like [Alteribacillus persepolensis]
MDLLCHLYEERMQDPYTKGILIVEKRKDQEPFTDFFDVVLIVVTEKPESTAIKHYNCSGLRTALHVLGEVELFQSINTESNKKMMDWLFEGRVLFNRNNYITNLKKRLCEFPVQDRLREIGQEFAKLINRYEDGKSLFYRQRYLDAFHHIAHALHHLARLSVIEQGFYPEVTVWEQVKRLDPETYKLYHELIVGDEPLEKRLELLLIGIDFAIRSKVYIGKAHLISVMNKKSREWSFTELVQAPELKDYAVDLEMLVQHLVKNKQLTEVEMPDEIAGMYCYKYAP